MDFGASALVTFVSETCGVGVPTVERFTVAPGMPRFPSASCENVPDGDLFMNYMDYVDDDTMVMFTDGQVARMHAALEFARPDLGRPADVPDDPPALVSPKARRRRPVS